VAAVLFNGSNAIGFETMAGDLAGLKDATDLAGTPAGTGLLCDGSAEGSGCVVMPPDAPESEAFWFDPRSDFTSLGYMEDINFARLPADANPPFLYFVNQTNALGASNPSSEFSFDSFSPPGLVQAYLSGAGILNVPGPQPVPEPASVVLFGTVVFCLIVLGLRRKYAA